jgi:leucyl aminopeptidase
MQLQCFIYEGKADLTEIILVNQRVYQQWLQKRRNAERLHLNAIGFSARPGEMAFLTNENGYLTAIVYGCLEDRWPTGDLPNVLPQGQYKLNDPYGIVEPFDAFVGFGLGSYSYRRYERGSKANVQLYLPPDYYFVETYVNAWCHVRQLINKPASHLGPQKLAESVKSLADEFKAQYHEIVGSDLLDHNYPGIHAVGRASKHQPRLAELTWGNDNHPTIVLVGKGVCFDSGGLDIKGASGMEIMHKDMGGAANILGLARLIMANELPVQLVLYIPAVENAISGDAYRPSDLVTMRDGTSVEIKNTDAEGRMVMADALVKAKSLNPELVIDFATLTGAMRVALGPDVPGIFSNDEALARDIQACSQNARDLVWMMPYYQDYYDFLKGNLGDMTNASTTPYGGGIVAALFLGHFIQDTPWVHMDLMAWNIQSKPGRPKGGEAMGILAFYHYLQQRFSHSSTR